MENLESNRNENYINTDEIARGYMEKLRSEILEFKNKNLDIHLSHINPDDLTEEDLIIFDKAKKYNLSKEEFKTYKEKLKDYFVEQKRITGKFDPLSDSRSNFAAMITNMIISEEEVLKHHNQ